MNCIKTAEEFNNIISSNVSVCVDFYADWCGPCKMMTPVLDALAVQYEGKCVWGKVNVDEVPAIAEKFKIVNIPALLFFKNGELIEKSIGARPAVLIQKSIDGIL